MARTPTTPLARVDVLGRMKGAFSGKDSDYPVACGEYSRLDGRFHAHKRNVIFGSQGGNGCGGSGVACKDHHVCAFGEEVVAYLPASVLDEVWTLVSVWAESIVREIDITLPGENSENLPQDGQPAYPGIHDTYRSHNGKFTLSIE